MLHYVRQELAEYNKKFEQKFGHIFIICASGKSASEMLAAVKARCTSYFSETVESQPSKLAPNPSFHPLHSLDGKI